MNIHFSVLEDHHLDDVLLLKGCTESLHCCRFPPPPATFPPSLHTIYPILNEKYIKGSFEE